MSAEKKKMPGWAKTTMKVAGVAGATALFFQFMNDKATNEHARYSEGHAAGTSEGAQFCANNLQTKEIGKFGITRAQLDELTSQPADKEAVGKQLPNLANALGTTGIAKIVRVTAAGQSGSEYDAANFALLSEVATFRGMVQGMGDNSNSVIAMSSISYKSSDFPGAAAEVVVQELSCPPLNTPGN